MAASSSSSCLPLLAEIPAPAADEDQQALCAEDVQNKKKRKKKRTRATRREATAKKEAGEAEAQRNAEQRAAGDAEVTRLLQEAQADDVHGAAADAASAPGLTPSEPASAHRAATQAESAAEEDVEAVACGSSPTASSAQPLQHIEATLQPAGEERLAELVRSIEQRYQLRVNQLTADHQAVLQQLAEQRETSEAALRFSLQARSFQLFDSHLRYKDLERHLREVTQRLEDSLSQCRKGSHAAYVEHFMHARLRLADKDLEASQRRAANAEEALLAAQQERDQLSAELRRTKEELARRSRKEGSSSLAMVEEAEDADIDVAQEEERQALLLAAIEGMREAALRQARVAAQTPTAWQGE